MELKIEHLSKQFKDKTAVNDVNLTLTPGVWGLLGANGAGKTTLMRMIADIMTPTNGAVYYDGKDIRELGEVYRSKFGFLPQDFGYHRDFTVKDYLEYMAALKDIPTRATTQKINHLLDILSLSDVKKKKISNLSGGMKRRVGIAQAMLNDPEILVMDEPTAALTERETATLFNMMRKMKARGVAIVYISHRMEEVFSECDTITVMRDGHTIITKPTAEISVDEVVRHMVGRSIDEFYPARTTTPGEVVMSVDNLKPEGFDNEISFSLRKGEILGVAGLMGAGRTEIMRAIFGVDKHNGGTVTVNGSVLNCKKPEDAIKAGIAFITENRKSEGLILDFSIGSNITLPNLGEICPSHILDKGKLNSFADELSKKLGVKTQSIHEPASSLSGGNQQKVVIAKWVGKKPSIIIMDEPTRGIDIGAKRDIYDLMNELTNDGVSIIMVSSELPEVLGMSDRVMVIHEGRVAGILDRSEATPESIMTLATGGQ